MTHMRYWATCLMTAICGGFIAIERFAFAQDAAVWIAFGVAIAATVFSLAGLALALLRENHAFSGLSAVTAFAGAWTIIAMRVFSEPTALWLAFAGGLVLLAVSLRALALHETTMERVTYALEHGVAVELAIPGDTPPIRSALARRLEISAPMRNWTYWLMHTGLAVAGAFIVLMTFALTVPGTSYAASPRWIAFAVAIATTCVALGALMDRGLARDGAKPSNSQAAGRLAALILTGASVCASIATIVTMDIYTGTTARWIAFAMGCAIAGISLLAYVVHELTSERVRHELEIAEPSHRAQHAAAQGA